MWRPLYFKRIIDIHQDDSVSEVYQNIFKYSQWSNRENNALDLWAKYSLPLKNEDISTVTKETLKSILNKQVKAHAFVLLTGECSCSRKTWQLKFE